jgi:hypothetical protein
VLGGCGRGIKKFLEEKERNVRQKNVTGDDFKRGVKYIEAKLHVFTFAKA